MEVNKLLPELYTGAYRTRPATPDQQLDVWCEIVRVGGTLSVQLFMTKAPTGKPFLAGMCTSVKMMDGYHFSVPLGGPPIDVDID